MAAVLKTGAAAWRDEGTTRYPIYRAIHKGLRGFMADTLLRVGRMDVTDDCERAQVIDQIRGLLGMCRGHLGHENDYLHPAIEMVEDGGSAKVANEHVAHIVAITTLEQQVAQFESAPAERRNVLAHELYLDLSNFVAENFEHMVVEETEHHAVLFRHYSDEQLHAIEHSIVSTMTPEQSLAGMRWMLPHLNAFERAAMLGGMKLNAPASVFEAVLALAAELLNQRDFYKLQKALAEPGVV